MFPMISDVPFATLPLSWVGQKRRPTQFNSRKNAPGYGRYNTLAEVGAAMMGTTLDVVENTEEPATTPAPEEVTDGDLKQVLIVDDGKALTKALLATLPSSPEARPVEMPQLPESK